MRYIAIAIAVIIALWIAWFSYAMWLRPVDQPTPELRRLESHFIRTGLVGHIYPVRHGFSHSRVIAVAAFEIKGYPLPFVLTAYANDSAAAAGSGQKSGLPQELQPAKNGNVVLDFPSWGDDTFKMAQSVRQAFLSYRGES
jgi:hypothetical protein